MNFAKPSKSSVVERAFERETAEAPARDVPPDPFIGDFRAEVEA